MRYLKQQQHKTQKQCAFVHLDFKTYSYWDVNLLWQLPRVTTSPRFLSLSIEDEACALYGAILHGPQGCQHIPIAFQPLFWRINLSQAWFLLSLLAWFVGLQGLLPLSSDPANTGVYSPPWSWLSAVYDERCWNE